MSFLGKIKNVFSKHTNAIQTEPNGVYCPVGGKIIPLQEIQDEVFSQGILGMGCGITPNSDTVLAPFDGEVIQVADTKHALGLKSNSGIELLVHVGLDTVDMGGEGFNLRVKLGEKVKCGQPLLDFSTDEIEAAGHLTTTVVVVTNSYEYGEVKVCVSGEVFPLDKLLETKEKPQ